MIKYDWGDVDTATSICNTQLKYSVATLTASSGKTTKHQHYPKQQNSNSTQVNFSHPLPSPFMLYAHMENLCRTWSKRPVKQWHDPSANCEILDFWWKQCTTSPYLSVCALLDLRREWCEWPCRVGFFAFLQKMPDKSLNRIITGKANTAEAANQTNSFVARGLVSSCFFSVLSTVPCSWLWYIVADSRNFP